MGGTVDEDAGLHFLDSCNQTYVGNILGNHIWRDVNTNGKYDYREKGVAGVEVDLWRRESYELGFGSYTGRTTTTNDFGYYEFDCLRDGQYYMVLNGVDEFTTTRPYRSPNDDINGDQNCHLAEDWHPSGAKIRGGFIDLEAGTEPWGKPRAAGNMNVTYDGALDCDDEQIDIVLVVDRSGSMSGESLLQAKKDGRDFMEFGDKPTARFGLVAFGSDADLLSELPQPTEHAQNQLHALSHSGSTRMEEGIALAVQHLQAEAIPGRFQAILVLSDGHATDEEAAANAARAATEQGIAVLAWTEGPSGDEDFMRDEIASSPEYFEASPDEKDVQEVVDSLIPSACGDPSGGNLVCPVGAVTTVDISTGR
ncbi:MAG: VWA domain-containing protein, partial [Anaerolineae bacterium]